MDKKELDLRIKIGILACLIIITSILTFYFIFLPLKNKIYNLQYQKFSECIRDEAQKDIKKMNWKIPTTSEEGLEDIRKDFERDGEILNKCCGVSGMQNDDDAYRILKNIQIEELKRLNR